MAATCGVRVIGRDRYGTDLDALQRDLLDALADGDVLFEGNFRPDTHASLLSQLIALSDVDVHAFFVDVSLDESLRRHATRPQVISVEKMTELHPVAVPLGVPGEVVIPETSTVDATVALVLVALGHAQRDEVQRDRG